MKSQKTLQRAAHFIAMGVFGLLFVSILFYTLGYKMGLRGFWNEQSRQNWLQTKDAVQQEKRWRPTIERYLVRGKVLGVPDDEANAENKLSFIVLSKSKAKKVPVFSEQVVVMQSNADYNGISGPEAVRVGMRVFVVGVPDKSGLFRGSYLRVLPQKAARKKRKKAFRSPKGEARNRKQFSGDD